MDYKDQSRQQLADALFAAAQLYLDNELALQQPGLRPDSGRLDLLQEARTISHNMAENLYTTFDVHLRQLLYPGQKQRTDDWLRTQNYMHRREDGDNRSVK